MSEKGIVRGATPEAQGPADAAQADAANNLRQDMYDFHQGPPPVKAGDDRQSPQGPPPAGDQYDYHQGPGDRAQQGPTGPDGKPLDMSKLHQTAKLETTLYDMATKSLLERSKQTGEKVNKDNIYHEVNRIMVLNGYEKSNLEGRTNLNDHMLKRQWNSVKHNQEFKLYGEADEPRKKEAPKEAPKKEKEPKAPKEDPNKGQKPGKDQPAPADRFTPVPGPGDKRTAVPTERQAPTQGDKAVANEPMPTREQFKTLITQEIDRRTTLPPLEQNQTYSQFVKKYNEKWTDDQVFTEAKRLKDINGEPNGQPVRLMSPQERTTAIDQSMQQYEKMASERAAAERTQAQEKGAQERAAQERAAQEKATQERAVRDKAAQDKALQDKAAQDKAAQERAAMEKKNAAAANRPAPVKGEKPVLEAIEP